MTRIACLFLVVLSVGFAEEKSPNPITLFSLLEEMVDRDTLARLPDPTYTCGQFSSYDRKSIHAGDEPGWFANDDRGEFLRTEINNDRKEWVMMDAEGPGAVVRIWSANPMGTLRVYLDEQEEPVIEAPMIDVLGGKWLVEEPLSAFRSKGYNLYLPIPYAGRCKITSDAEDFYYQINYRTYPEGTAVQTLVADDLTQLAEALESTGKALGLVSGSEPAVRGNWLEEKGPVAPGASLVLDLPQGSGVVERLVIKTHAPPVNRTLVVEAEFDGEQTIWCPLSDFVGAGVGAVEMKDFYRVLSADQAVLSLWPMPYQEEGRIKITNLGENEVSLELSCQVEEWTWDDQSLHFYARWYFDHPIPTRPMRDWNYVRIEGQGVYVGDTLSVINPSHIWWGEGDEKIYVDGEAFPSHFGTGTEDYYGYAWCWPEPFQAPFHSQARCDGFDLGHNNWGHTTLSRVRALDAIPFQRSLTFDMEVWHWRSCEIGYGVATFFYARPGVGHNRPPRADLASSPVPRPKPLPPPFQIEGAIECEDMEILACSEGLETEPQKLGEYGGEICSGDCQLWVKGQAPGDFIELSWALPDTAEYYINLYAIKSFDYGIIRCWVNGERAGEDLDLLNPDSREVATTGPIPLGAFTPQDGQITLRLEVVGGNPKSEGTRSFFGVDCIVASPVQ